MAEPQKRSGEANPEHRSSPAPVSTALGTAPAFAPVVPASGEGAPNMSERRISEAEFLAALAQHGLWVATAEPAVATPAGKQLTFVDATIEGLDLSDRKRRSSRMRIAAVSISKAAT